MSVDQLADRTRQWISLIDTQLAACVGPDLDCPARLRDAMHYSLMAGGKRLRPLFVLLANDACGGTLESALPAACAVEMIHTYSLIHDDLPAMDDDDLRRGRPTLHKQFDEATAILAGDALMSLAFELLATMRPAFTAQRCVLELARSSGAVGMVGGQMDDLFAADGPGTIDWLQRLHERKTGALLVASLRMGAWIADATPEQMQALTTYGERVGLAFQIADDLLDVEGEASKLGKNVRKDDAAGKLTYPGLLGLDESRHRAQELIDDARLALTLFGPRAAHLATLARYIVERDH